MLFAAVLLTACTVKNTGLGTATLYLSPDTKEITVQAVTADGSAVQVEGCTVTEFPSGEGTFLTPTGTKVVLKGVLTELDCSGNRLTSLDIRGLTALRELSCDINQLTSLDVRGLTALKYLFCGNNQLTSLDIQGLTALQELYCNSNQLTSLDVRGLTALKYLFCGDNQLTSLDIQGLTALQELDCSGNQLTSLDMQGLTALQSLLCNRNKLTSLDVREVPALKILNCHSNRFEEDSLIRILNALPDRKAENAEDAGLALVYTEDYNRLKINSADFTASVALKAAFKTAAAKNWKLYKRTVEGNGEEIKLTGNE